MKSADEPERKEVLRKEIEERKKKIEELKKKIEEQKKKKAGEKNSQKQLDQTVSRAENDELKKQGEQAREPNVAANAALFGAVGLATAATCTYLPWLQGEGLVYLGMEAHSTLGNGVSGGAVFLVLAAASQIGSEYKPHKTSGLLVPTFLAAAYDFYTTGDKFSALICFGSALITVVSWVSRADEVSGEQGQTV